MHTRIVRLLKGEITDPKDLYRELKSSGPHGGLGKAIGVGRLFTPEYDPLVREALNIDEEAKTITVQNNKKLLELANQFRAKADESKLKNNALVKMFRGNKHFDNNLNKYALCLALINNINEAVDPLQMDALKALMALYADDGYFAKQTFMKDDKEVRIYDFIKDKYSTLLINDKKDQDELLASSNIQPLPIQLDAPPSNVVINNMLNESVEVKTVALGLQDPPPDFYSDISNAVPATQVLSVALHPQDPPPDFYSDNPDATSIKQASSVNIVEGPLAPAMEIKQQTNDESDDELKKVDISAESEQEFKISFLDSILNKMQRKIQPLEELEENLAAKQTLQYVCFVKAIKKLTQFQLTLLANYMYAVQSGQEPEEKRFDLVRTEKILCSEVSDQNTPTWQNMCEAVNKQLMKTLIDSQSRHLSPCKYDRYLSIFSQHHGRDFTNWGTTPSEETFKNRFIRG
jgi:hypothetical protein